MPVCRGRGSSCSLATRQLCLAAAVAVCATGSWCSRLAFLVAWMEVTLAGVFADGTAKAVLTISIIRRVRHLTTFSESGRSGNTSLCSKLNHQAIREVPDASTERDPCHRPVVPSTKLFVFLPDFFRTIRVELETQNTT